MTVAFSEDGRDFVRRDWLSLVKADPSGTIFSTPDYLKLYWEEFGDDFGVLLAFVERDGEQIGTAAFEVLGSTIRFLGGTEVTDYLGPLAAPPDAETVAAQLIQGLAGRGGWEELDLRGLPEDGRWLGLLRTALDVLALGEPHRARQLQIHGEGSRTRNSAAPGVSEQTRSRNRERCSVKVAGACYT